jgi:sulfonate transport system ATP-binding protein
MMSSDLVVNISSMRYPGSKKPGDLIKDLSFTVRSGSFVSFLGPSGAGKTTILRMIAGLERRYRGEIMLGGEQVLRPSREIQIVFQENRLLPWKTVTENISFAIHRSNSQETKAKIEKWLENVQLKDQKDSWPKDLSGGEEGRVAFARTFVDPPQVLLLDEPFRNLDMVTRFRLQDVLLNTLEAQPITVLMVSHNIEDALLLSDVIYVLSNSPMRIESEFPVKFEKPRDRNCRELRDLSSDIERSLKVQAEAALSGNSTHKIK